MRFLIVLIKHDFRCKLFFSVENIRSDNEFVESDRSHAFIHLFHN